MIQELQPRYPGAQPFADNDWSRRVFFGRSRENTLLTDQIIANRLVVVYARSGVGKSSLLNAGVAQRLRNEHFFPLPVRVNVPKRDLATSVMDEARMSSQSQQVEYQAGDHTSLWHFFKTVEIWQKDTLLTPVLILDQFEELFTLHLPEDRDKFLTSLGYLVRGVRPTNNPDGQHNNTQLSESAPMVGVVMSLREDFLGFLEEASDRIPQILEQRFRLLPLSVSAAAEALIEPARLPDSDFATPPFEYTEEARALILSYLSNPPGAKAREPKSAVEPFQLQLICQRVEQAVAHRLQSGKTISPITVADLGGRTGLGATLAGFYRTQVRSIRTTSIRRRVKRLCEEYLISSEGRRISMDAVAIGRVLRLDEVTLNDLVNRRLLRSDHRANTTYYELSHDTLIAPILASRRGRGLSFGAAGLLFGTLLSIASVIFAGTSLFALGAFVTPDSELVRGMYAGMKEAYIKEGMAPDEAEALLKYGFIGSFILFSAIAVAFGLWTMNTWRRSTERLRRYSHRREIVTRSPRSTRLTAGTLALILGGLGVHKFYLGYYLQGVILLVCTLIGSRFPWYLGTLAAGLVGMVEGAIYFAKSDEQFIARYIEGRRAWF